MRQTVIRLGCPEAKTGVLKVGVDLGLFEWRTTAPVGPPKFVTVAAFRPKKGLHYLIEAFAQVQSKLPDASLTLIGDGPLKPQCMSLAATLGVDKSVEFTGHVPPGKVAELLFQAHVYVQPSVTAPNRDREGIPVTLMEAMARGLPSVATRHSGIPELLEHGISGLLVAERDVIALAQAMLELAQSPDRWPAMTRAARAQVEREHNLTTQTVKLQAIYANLLGMPARSVEQFARAG